MEKMKEYRNTLFPPETLEKGIVEFDGLVKEMTVQDAKAYGLAKKNHSLPPWLLQ
jgi:hypothetical protein